MLYSVLFPLFSGVITILSLYNKICYISSLCLIALTSMGFFLCNLSQMCNSCKKILSERKHPAVFEIWKTIKNAAKSLSTKQFLIASILGSILFIIISIVIRRKYNPYIQYMFLMGSFLGMIACNLIGLSTVIVSYLSSLQLATDALDKNEQKARNESYMPGLSISTLMIFTCSILFLLPEIIYIILVKYSSITNIVIENNSFVLKYFNTYIAIGAVCMAAFIRLFGGIYTKGADLAADLVGKLQLNLREDDITNPACFADAVGDLSGDAVGASQTIFSFAFFSLGLFINDNNLLFTKQLYLLLPLLILSVGNFFIGTMKNKSWKKSLEVYFICLLFIPFILLLVKFWPELINNSNITRANMSINVFYILISILIIKIICWATTFVVEGYGSSKVAKDSETGASINVLSGISIGKLSTFFLVTSICLVFLLFTKILVEIMPILIKKFYSSSNVIPIESYLYDYKNAINGIIINGLALKCIIYYITCFSFVLISLDLAGPAADNAGLLVEAGTQDQEARVITDSLDMEGNTIKAITKSYIGVLGLLFLGIIKNYFPFTIFISSKYFSSLLGAMLPFLVIALCLIMVTHCSGKIITLTQEQVENNTNKLISTDYNKIINSLAKISIVGSSYIILVLFCTVIVFYSVLKENMRTMASMSLLLSSIQGIYMTITGATWDNAKKKIEKELLGKDKKDSEKHRAAVIGDTIGDPFKDTAGTAIVPISLFILLVFTVLE